MEQDNVIGGEVWLYSVENFAMHINMLYQLEVAGVYKDIFKKIEFNFLELVKELKQRETAIETANAFHKQAAEEAIQEQWRLIKENEGLLEALNKICEMNYQQAKDQYGDRNKAKSWSCVKVAEEAIKNCKPVRTLN